MTQNHKTTLLKAASCTLHTNLYTTEQLNAMAARLYTALDSDAAASVPARVLSAARRKSNQLSEALRQRAIDARRNAQLLAR